MFRDIKPKNSTLTDLDKQVLSETMIVADAPGSILHEFNVMLSYVIDKQPTVTKTHQLSLKYLIELNEQMKRPLQHGLARPVQKSLPNLNGLYLILRASGLTYVDITGKSPVLIVDDSALHAWRSLNPTEQYFTLFGALILRGTEEILGDRASMYYRSLSKCLQLFHQLWITPSNTSINDNNDPDYMKYGPDWHNLALLEMFGFINIKKGSIVPKKGWQLKEVSSTLFGNAIFRLLQSEVMREPEWMFSIDDVSTIPLGTLQPLFQPYFPEWQHNLPDTEQEFLDGLYTFKVALSKQIWRRIAISGQHDLESLVDIILSAFDFDNDHLHRFIYQTKIGTSSSIQHSYLEDGPFTDEVRVGDVPLRIGSSMLFNFDFGDDWYFEVILEHIDKNVTLDEVTILESHGEAPLQYPSYDDE